MEGWPSALLPQELVIYLRATLRVMVWLAELPVMLTQAALSLSRCVSSLALEGTTK